MDTFYFHKPNTYSYRGVNSYIQCIKFCTCVENVTITLFPLFIKHSLMISVNEHSFQLYAIIINKSYIKLLTLQEHLNSPPVFSGVRVTRSLVLYACFVDRCLTFCLFSFGHCVVCSSTDPDYLLVSSNSSYALARTKHGCSLINCQLAYQ